MSKWEGVKMWVLGVGAWVWRNMVVPLLRLAIVIFLVGLLVLACVPEWREVVIVDHWLALVGLLPLTIIAFWEYIERFLMDRELAVGPEGVRIGTPQSGPGERGSVRDNFLYLGKFHIWKRDKEHYEQALEFFQAAHRMRRSILSAFRCMQCCAQLDDRASKVREWYCEARLLAEKAPLSELVNRGEFTDWVLRHRSDDKDRLFEAARESIDEDPPIGQPKN